LIDKSTITADVKVAFEKEALNVETEVVGDKTIELAAQGNRYNDVAITWAVEGNNAVIEDGNLKLTMPTTEDVTVTLTATLTCGEESDTKEFSILLKKYELPAADSVISITKALEIGETLKGDSADKYYISGKIIEIVPGKDGSVYYGNMTIEDANGKSIYVYGTYSADGSKKYGEMENAPKVGDTVKLYSIVSYYKSAQLKNAWIVEVVSGSETPEEPNSSEESDSSEVVTPAESPLEEGVAYTVSANNANGTLYLKGTVTGGRWDCSLSAADAVSVYVEDVAGGQLLYMNVDGTKTYFVFADSSTGGSTTTDASAATVFEWNASLQTLEVADDDNARGFGAQPGSTYNNFSCYAVSNTGYNWGKFTPVAA
jgi:hypothetical protein